MVLNTLNTPEANQHGRPRHSSRPPAETHHAPGGHGECGCPNCPRGARAGHRRALAVFQQRRDELASRSVEFVPTALAHSALASRQWVSDELSQAARTVADRADHLAVTGSNRGWRRTAAVSWGGVSVLLVTQVTTAGGAGWTPTRTAGLLAAVVVALSFSLSAYLHRKRGGPLAALTGADNRFSTSLTVASCWALACGYISLVLALLAAVEGPGGLGLTLAKGGGLLTVWALTGLLATLTRRIVAWRVREQRLQKVPARRPRAADLFTDDAGRASFADIQYVSGNLAVALFVLASFAQQPDRLPELPWVSVVLIGASAAVYLASKCTEGGRPVIMSVVRAREIGGLDSPLRTGDDIEIRGTGFVPPGAGSPDHLARLVVRIGAVYAHVPLVPVSGGFRNPADTVLTLPLPADVEPGGTEIQVITATGTETNRYPVEVVD